MTFSHPEQNAFWWNPYYFIHTIHTIHSQPHSHTYTQPHTHTPPTNQPTNHLTLNPRVFFPKSLTKKERRRKKREISEKKIYLKTIKLHTSPPLTTTNYTRGVFIICHGFWSQPTHSCRPVPLRRHRSRSQRLWYVKRKKETPPPKKAFSFFLPSYLPCLFFSFAFVPTLLLNLNLSIPKKQNKFLHARCAHKNSCKQIRWTLFLWRRPLWSQLHRLRLGMDNGRDYLPLSRVAEIPETGTCNCGVGAQCRHHAVLVCRLCCLGGLEIESLP